MAKYIKPYAVIKSIEERINIKDEGIVVDENTAKEIDDAERQRQDMVAQEQAKAIQEEADQKRQLHDEKMSKLDKDKQNLDVKLVTELSKDGNKEKNAA